MRLGVPQAGCKICAWIGIEHLADRTIGLGDDTAAIWVSKALIIP